MIKQQVDFIAASFVRKASDVTNLRQLLSENNGQLIKIICKIEVREAALLRLRCLRQFYWISTNMPCDNKIESRRFGQL